MLFGSKSAPEHYQKKVSQILEGSEGHISITDDMLIYAKTQEEHDLWLKAVLKNLDYASSFARLSVKNYSQMQQLTLCKM